MIRKPRKKFGGALGEAFEELWEAVEAGQIVESDGVSVDRTTRGTVVRARGGGEIGEDGEDSFTSEPLFKLGEVRCNLNEDANIEASRLVPSEQSVWLRIGAFLFSPEAHGCFIAELISVSELLPNNSIPTPLGFFAVFRIWKHPYQTYNGDFYFSDLGVENNYRVGHFIGNTLAAGSFLVVASNSQFSHIDKAQLVTDIPSLEWLYLDFVSAPTLFVLSQLNP